MRIFSFPDCFTQFPWRGSNLTSLISSSFSNQLLVWRFSMEIIERWREIDQPLWTSSFFLQISSKEKKKKKNSFNFFRPCTTTLIFVCFSKTRFPHLDDFRIRNELKYRLRNLCNVHRIRTIRTFEILRMYISNLMRQCSVAWAHIYPRMLATIPLYIE